MGIWLEIELEGGISRGRIVELISFLTMSLPKPFVGLSGIYSKSEIFLPNEQLIGESENLEKLRVWIWAEYWLPEAIASLVRRWFWQQTWLCRIQIQETPS